MSIAVLRFAPVESSISLGVISPQLLTGRSIKLRDLIDGVITRETP
jgi:hypothetical protein